MKQHDTYEFMHTVLRDAIAGNPSASEAEIKELVWDKLKGNMDVFRLLFDNWFNLNWTRYETEVQEVVSTNPKTGEATIGQSVVVRQKTRRPAVDVKETTKVVAKRVIMESSSLILMNLIMPNGKKLSECTGAECIKFGGWLVAVGKKIGPTNKVGKSLSELDLQNLFKRNAA